MLDPLTLGVGAALWLTFRNQGNSKFGVLTSEREEVYHNALEFLHDPLKLEELANNFQREGLKVQAAMLRKRAEWRGRSELLRVQHETIFDKAIASTNVHAILGVAEAFEKMTATAKAKQLRERAKAVYDEAEAEAQAKVIVEPTKLPAIAKPKSNGIVKESIPRNTSDEKAVETEILS